MRRPPVRSRPGRVALAVVLVAVAASIVALEPLPHGPVLLTLTRDHGVDSGDLPAVALLVLAAWIILV